MFRPWSYPALKTYVPDFAADARKVSKLISSNKVPVWTILIGNTIYAAKPPIPAIDLAISFTTKNLFLRLLLCGQGNITIASYIFLLQA